MTQTEATTPGGGPTSAPMIRFEDVHTAWREGRVEPGALYSAEALSGLTLTLPAGGITVLLGDRGSGKGLLALHLLGEVEPHSGRVLVGEKSLWELPEPERSALRNSFGLFRGGTSIQESRLVAGQTVRESLSSHIEPSPDGDDEATLSRWLQLLDLAEVPDTQSTDLNPGQRRRLALWLALVDDPAVVVIDNPGEALDCRHFEAMIDIICHWHSRVGATMLISVHSLRVATELADVVAVVRDGKVIAQGSPAEVLSGVDDDESFEQKFDTGLGGVVECDPQRTLRGWQQMTRRSRRLQIALVITLFVMGVIVVWLLTSGLITNPLLP
ncbi:MAG TPA: ATP-binding cassette domain-containing protein [Pseudonocardia sp.]|jgi:ABC-type multidrug transport system ATPase subunit